jgi:dTDP-4-amino-4,6-dideoxygalactose transaminase
MNPKLAIAGGTPIRTTPFARWPVFDDREKAALNEVLESGVWGGYSPKVKEFEERFAKFQGTRYAVCASNGTVTLEAALQAAGVKPGDEVIVPPITFVATATAVMRVGAVPVFADIGRDYNIDPKRIQEAISDRTRAVMVVHFAGRPADMDAISAIAQKHNLVVIEDAAHAHGAWWKDRPVGNFGDIASFSFQSSKNLSAGEGGILVGNNAELIEGARSIFNQGRVTGGGWYEHENLGTNQRLSGWQAAVLIPQLERLPEQLRHRAGNAKYLDERIQHLDFIEPLAGDPRVTRHSYYLYTIRLRLDRLDGISRNQFVKALSAEGIPGVGTYPHPLYENKVFQKYKNRRTECPEAERMCKDSFWVSHEIMLAEQKDLDDFLSALSKVAANSAELISSVAV